MSLLRRIFPKRQCPACGGMLEREFPEVTLGYFTLLLSGNILLDLLFAIVAALVAAIAFRYFGEIAGVAVVIVVAIYLDRRISKYRCKSCAAIFHYRDTLSQGEKHGT